MNRVRPPAGSPVGAGVTKVAVERAAAAPVAGRVTAAGAKAEAAALAARQKTKLVRDSFTIPKSEYLVLDALKLRAARLMRPTKKSEVLRAGIAALDAMSDKAFLSVINAVPSLKTGRPKSTTTPTTTPTATPPPAPKARPK